MGLDQYLIKKTWVGGMYDHSKVNGVIDVLVDNKKLPIKLERVTYINEQIGYWRKANAIHKWFVDNVQNGKDDCGEYYVHKEKLESLLELCHKVKDNPYNADKFLPTQRGFLFGDEAYDEWYFDIINKTISVLNNALEEEGEIYYSSSW